MGNVTTMLATSVQAAPGRLYAAPGQFDSLISSLRGRLKKAQEVNPMDGVIKSFSETLSAVNELLVQQQPQWKAFLATEQGIMSVALDISMFIAGIATVLSTMPPASDDVMKTYRLVAADCNKALKAVISNPKFMLLPMTSDEAKAMLNTNNKQPESATNSASIVMPAAPLSGPPTPAVDMQPASSASTDIAAGQSISLSGPMGAATVPSDMSIPTSGVAVASTGPLAPDAGPTSPVVQGAVSVSQPETIN
ncbi:MAG: hypothetical protein QG632_702 [Candidatus Dependentiae bacterium]|nr:hypothetical protein [Candidatus Dependentiae bacterium]